MTSEPTKSTDTPPTTVWSNDVAGGGVAVDDIPGVTGLKEGEAANVPSSSSSKKKKKKKNKQQQQQLQQQQKDKVENEVKAEGNDDEDDAETPGITEEVTEFIAMPPVTAIVDTKPPATNSITVPDEAEVATRPDPEPLVVEGTTESTSIPMEIKMPQPMELEAVKDMEVSADSLFDPVHGTPEEDLFGQPPASFAKDDDLFASNEPEQDDFAGILGASARDDANAEVDVAAESTIEPIEMEQEQKVELGIDSAQDKVNEIVATEEQPEHAKLSAEAEQGNDLFAANVGAEDDLFGTAEPESAHLFGSSEAAAQGEPVFLEPVLPNDGASAEAQIETEELFSDQAHTDTFDLGSPPESPHMPLAVEESDEPGLGEESQTDLFSGTGDAQEEYFSQIVQAGHDVPDAQPVIPSVTETTEAAETHVEDSPSQAVQTRMNGESPDPFGPEGAEDDFFSRPTAEIQSVHEEDQLDLPVAGSARASTKTSDLFQTDETDDLFAGLGAPGPEEDAFGTNGGGLSFAGTNEKLGTDSEMFAEDVNLDSDDWMGQAASVPTPDPNPTSLDKPDEVDGSDLDLMGVPDGWVDGSGTWCWYTEDERMEVAKQMVADGTAEAPEKPFPGSKAKQEEFIETAPAQPSPLVNPYAPSPVQSYAPSPSQSYTPYVPSPPVVAAAIPYVPTPARNAYTPVPAAPYVPSAYSSSAFVTGGYTPSSSGSQPYGVQPAVPKPKVTPASALERTKTSTAYDPPVITSRNLSRPPSAAPVLSQYTPMSMPTSAPVSLPVSPPPPAPGPSRAGLPPRNTASIKSTLGGRSTPTAYDPPVPAMSRQASYARLRPAAEVAPPLPPLPPVTSPVVSTLPALPPAPPRGPSRNANLIQPPPAAGSYRPPSRARNVASSSPVPLPHVPPLPRGMASNQHALPASGTIGPVPGLHPVPHHPAAPPLEHPQQAAPPASLYTAPGTLPPQPDASSARGPPANVPLLPPNAVSQPETDRLTPQRGQYDVVQADPTWPPQNVSPAKSRPILRQDTFQPPDKDDELVDPEDATLEQLPGDPESGFDSAFEQEQQVVDPYKPLPASSPATSTYIPVAAPNAYQPSPVPAFQPPPLDQMTPSAYLTPAPNGFAFPTENFASPPNSYESPGVSNYAPAPENAPKSLSEDILARASDKAKRVPCVSFGPQGQLLVVFQTASTDPAFSETGQRLLPAYGDTSRSQKVELYPLSDVLSGAGDTAASSDWPGPLFVDGNASKVSASAKKKRDAVNAYIDTRVQEIQSGLVYLNASKKGDAGRQSAEAKMVMLQVIQLMIVADGKPLISDPTTKADLVDLLTKHLDAAETDSLRQRQQVKAESSASSADLQYLSRMLVKGQQQEAQQYAMQQQLWSHALLISSVMGPQAWQSCVDAFVAQGTSGGTELAQPLVTAYKLFGGTQQLAPAASQSGAWRDAIATVVANVKTADLDTLVRLADQLKQNNLVEASHLCYMLSPKLTEWASGSSSARVSLFGCRDLSQTARDLEVSELLEYALSFKAIPKGSDAFHGVPQLLPFKLQRAFEAFTAGRSTEARAYVDAVLAQTRAQKATSTQLVAIGKMAEALSGRIAGIVVTAAATKKGGKPNLENLGSWFEGRLTKFIAGDEEPEAKPAQPTSTKETAAAAAAVGPFSHYSAISSPNATPNLTRSSTYDPMAHQSIVPGPHTYRSGSAASYRPRQPSQLSMQRPTSAMSYRAQDTVPELTRIASHITEQDGFGSRRESEPEQVSEDAETPIHTRHAASDVQQEEEPAAAYQMPTWGQSYDEPVAAGEDGTNAEADDDGASSAAFINPMQAFMAPMAASTPTPSYEPQAESRAAFEDEDDDDLGLGNSSGKKPPAQAEKPGPTTEDKSKSAYEPAPKKEETVAPAAAQKGAAQDAGKGSWLGKWWGGKKEETVGPGPVKAKLGDESAFYYDKELKRWVNKTAGVTEAPKAPPPPPPGARPTPVPTSSAPPSKPATPMNAAPPGAAPPPPISRAPSVPAAGAPPSMSPAPRGTPPGPPGPPKPSGMNAADPPLSDPLAAPPPRKGAAKGKKDLRAKYVNIM